MEGRGTLFIPVNSPFTHFIHHPSLSLTYLGPHTVTEPSWALGPGPACAMGSAEMQCVVHLGRMETHTHPIQSGSGTEGACYGGTSRQ